MAGTFSEHLDRGEQALDDVNNAEAQAEFDAALALASLPHERAMALDGLATLHFRNGEPERGFKLLDEAAGLCLSELSERADGQASRALAQIYFDKAIFLTTQDRDEEALAALDHSLDRFLDRVTSAVPLGKELKRLRRCIAKTLNLRGSVLIRLERRQEALDCCDDLIRRFQDVDDLAVQRSVARSMFRRAHLFGDLGRQDKEIEAYDDLAARFGSSADLTIGETVLVGLENKLQIYRDQEDFETVIEICEQIISRYREESYWPIADGVARAMIRQAVALGRRGKHSKELAAYDTVFRLYSDAPHPSLRVHAAQALMFKAVSLNDADEVSAEIECYDEVIRRYAEDADREVRVVAADAIIHKGLSLGAIAEDAAEDTGEREADSEIACYDEVIARYDAEEFVPLQRAVAEALLHKAEVLGDVGRTAEASQCLDRLIASYDAIQDQDMHEIVNEARALQAEL